MIVEFLKHEFVCFEVLIVACLLAILIVGWYAECCLAVVAFLVIIDLKEVFEVKS